MNKDIKQAENNLFKIASKYSIGLSNRNKTLIALKRIKQELPEWKPSWLK